MIKTLLNSAAQLLTTSSDSPRLDAEVLLSHVTGKNRTWFMTWPDAELDAPIIARFHELLAQRRTGTPIAYLTGRREFWSRDFLVTAATLIPRPETELLVEMALQLATACPIRPLRIADLGTGSGAIAVTLALELPDAQVYAVDNCPDALAVARHNAERLGARNLAFLQGNWLQPLKEQTPLDIVVSNPPYIAAADRHLNHGDVRFEPQKALVSGADGLDAIRQIIRDTPGSMNHAGWLLLEHGYKQGPDVQALLAKANFMDVSGYKDLSGHVRISAGKKR
ncbi:peptide chain release factor N(5)-glutamine methyltransferase [Candidatus Methylospira mobilis]|uniref:Release factor glutamine methyltransferase n=1 Tax=Candidatus Methylospira mobilis TaxID=1808979 RepID=A0A5Q0BIW4_9GAMM|nr:peptide chain release factor N(5)-glutamine methyltransferase [Candidatus Methylospira mobilis]QFY43760.1 peptide chain release factor N(5)-glutamine methyltransferase [Candidatus Methylospira mobilis]WNV04749.1 peptide chain release factor N(5)-glutamine methyltransferase [Candidatus Methylospira mobilis]